MNSIKIPTISSHFIQTHFTQTLSMRFLSIFFFFLCAFLLCSCDDSSSKEPRVESKEAQFLTPSDFGITKHQLIAHPKEGEVAVLRLLWDDDLSHTIYDQIFYSPQEAVKEDVVLINLNNFKIENDWESDWILKVGKHTSPIENLQLSGYTFTASSAKFGIDFYGQEFLKHQNDAVGGEIKFQHAANGENGLDSKPADFYQFSLFITTIEEIQKIHPQWKLPKEGQISGTQAYVFKQELKANQN